MKSLSLPVSRASSALRTHSEYAQTKRWGDTALQVAAVALFGFAVASFHIPFFHTYLYAPSNVQNVGEVTEGDLIRTGFHLSNPHLYPVTVKEIVGGCGCTKTFADRSVPFTLRPFESVWANVSVDTASKKGAMHQTARVLTSDNPDNGTPRRSVSGPDQPPALAKGRLFPC